MDKRHCVVCLPNDRGNAMSAEKVCRCNGREVLLDDDGKLKIFRRTNTTRQQLQLLSIGVYS
jgi:hypothetical protein